MNKPAVSKAQLRRTVETLEDMGKTVAGVRILPDGAAEVLLGEPIAGSVTPALAEDDGWGEYDRTHGSA